MQSIALTRTFFLLAAKNARERNARRKRKFFLLFAALRGRRQVTAAWFQIILFIVLMALVDAKQRFIWASSGFPGNSHDAIIFQSTGLYAEIEEGKIINQVAKVQDGQNIYPMIIGDSAFPFKTWLVKPYTNAVLAEKQ